MGRRRRRATSSTGGHYPWPSGHVRTVVSWEEWAAAVLYEKDPIRVYPERWR